MALALCEGRTCGPLTTPSRGRGDGAARNSASCERLCGFNRIYILLHSRV